MKNEYILGSFKDYETGATDCHVIDFCLKGKKFKDLCSYYKYGVDDINVWPKTVLAEKMVHRKGNRKDIAAANRGKHDVKQQALAGVVDSNDMKLRLRWVFIILELRFFLEVNRRNFF